MTTENLMQNVEICKGILAGKYQNRTIPLSLGNLVDTVVELDKLMTTTREAQHELTLITLVDGLRKILNTEDFAMVSNLITKAFEQNQAQEKAIDGFIDKIKKG